MMPLRMKAIATFLKTALFIVLCVVGWTVLPVLFVVGGLALFLYALVVESFLSLGGGKASRPDDRAPGEMAERICTTEPPPSI
jgi:hypothetical protein